MLLELRNYTSWQAGDQVDKQELQSLAIALAMIHTCTCCGLHEAS